MNFLCNINQSFADLLRNYLNLLEERSSRSKIPLVAASERVNVDEAAPLCSITIGKGNVSGET